VPGASEDAAKHHREDVTSVERLYTIPYDAYYGSDKDKEVGTIHPHDGAYKNRAVDN
jgi:hypothetical protein